MIFTIFQNIIENRLGIRVEIEEDEMNNYDIQENNNIEFDDNFNKNVENIGACTDRDKACQTNIGGDELADLMATKLKLEKEIREITLSEESFVDNNSKTKYFTGLPSSKLLFVLHKNFSRFFFAEKPKVPLFQQLLITLMKLRLNLPTTYLAYRFVTCQLKKLKITIFKIKNFLGMQRQSRL